MSEPPGAASPTPAVSPTPAASPTGADIPPDEPGDGASPHSPEARRWRARRLRAELGRGYARLRAGSRAFEIARRVVVGVFCDGFIHAGNLAYMAILSLFPFFITATAILSLVGRTEDGVQALDAFLRTVPPNVAETIEQPVRDVMNARSGSLLWLGGLFGLWTVGSLIETIRDILRRAYGTRATSIWRYRLGSIGLIVISVIIMLLSFSAQVAITGLEQLVTYVVPQFDDWAASLAASRLVPALGLFAALYLLFYSLTPSAYRQGCPKWPGALVTTLWWVAVTALLPVALRYLADYDLTYGSLAGVMITLFFFYLVGLGLVIGAELNAALVESPEELDLIGQADNRSRRANAKKT